MKKKMRFVVLIGVTILVISGCGRKEKNDNETMTEGIISGGGTYSEQQVGTAARREPPSIELQPVVGEGDSLTIRACAYEWNWPEGADQMGAAIADSAAPLSEEAPWDTLILSDSAGGLQDCKLTIEVNPDELGIEMWNLADIGNYDAQGSRTAVYQREDIAVEDFSIPLQAGKVYEIYLRWEEDKVGENGGFGIAYYVFKTGWPVQGEEEGFEGLTETDNEEPTFPEAIFGDIDAEEVKTVEGISMTVTQATSEGASLEILNQTDKELTLGVDYELQVWQDGNWYQLDYIIDNWAFEAVGYIPEKDEPLQMEVNWTYFHGILPEGRYRITKTADVQEAGSSVLFRLAAEFTLESAEN